MAPSGLIHSMAWLRQYPREWLRPDLTAGLTAAAVVIPKAMAYATIAGLPLQVGVSSRAAVSTVDSERR